MEILDGLSEALDDLIAEMPAICGESVYSRALAVMEESKARTPVLSGALRDSHEIRMSGGRERGLSLDSSVTSRERITTATVRAGGVDAPYAVQVHEDLEAPHDNGQAKFMESAAVEEARAFKEAVGTGVRAGIRQRVGRRRKYRRIRV